MIITDAQAHIFAPEAPGRPWLPGARSWAHGDAYTVEELLEQMEAAGVDQAVLVPPSFEGDRNDVCLAAAVEYPERFRVMGRISLTDPASRGQLAGWRNQPGMLGVRLTFSRGEAAAWMTDGTADWFWGEAEDAGLPVMVFSPGLLKELGTIAERHPGLPLIVDHMGIRTDLRDADIDPVIEELLGLARHPNVAVKATSLPSNVSDEYPFSFLHPRIERVVDGFGPRRVFWGCDLTRLPCTYREAVTMFTEELDFFDDDDLEWVMGRGVREWLRWDG